MVGCFSIRAVGSPFVVLLFFNAGRGEATLRAPSALVLFVHFFPFLPFRFAQPLSFLPPLDVPGRSNPSPLSFFILIVRLVLESLPAAAHSPRIDSEGGSVPWNCSARFLSKKKKKELLCSLSVCVIDVPLVLQPIEIQLGCVCRFRFMERWSLGASVVALLLLLSAASHGRGSSVRFSYACWVAVVYKLASK